MRNKNSNIQGRSANVVKVTFSYFKELLIKERIRSLWEQILSFPLREVPALKRGATEENHCLIQRSHFDVRNFFSFLGLKSINNG